MSAAHKSRLVPFAGKEGPAVRPRQRTRAIDVTAPATPVAVDPAAHEAEVKQELGTLLTTYAIANAKKNAGTSEERKAKSDLNKKMADYEVDSFTGMVELNGNQVAFIATIAPREVEIMDPAKVLKLCGGDMKKFMAMVSVTKEAVEDALGKNAVHMVSKKITKPADISVVKVK